jgi:LysM repeat protein
MRARATIVATACILALGAAPAAGATRYTVRWGDTLTGIARSHHVGLLRLARRNHLRVSGILWAGTVLVIPGGGRPAAHTSIYVVRTGDTLTGIASRQGTSLLALARLNRRPPYATLLIGTRLRVPAAAGAPSARRHRLSRPHWRGRYRVRPGDTLSALAVRYGTRLGRLARANEMRVSDLLRIGVVLRVPLHGARAHPSRRVDARSAAEVEALLDGWSAHYGVDPSLVRAVAWQESGFHARITSSAGAWGVMQVMPMTWTFTEQVLIGHAVPHTTSGDIRIGVAYLHALLDEFGGNSALAVAAYYQGADSVREFGMFPGTRIYVRDVLSLRRGG